MGNYSLVIDTSNFKPYDISPALLILHDYRDTYNKLDEQLNKIAEEKGLYIPPEGTPYRATMDKYNQDFAALVDDFSRGMNTRNALKISEIRRRYLTDITPINRAAEAYNKYLDKLTALGPDAILGNNLTFDDFYGGKNPAIEYRSSKDIRTTTASVMQGLDNALTKSPELAGSIAKQYFVLKQQGLDGASALSEILKYNPLDLASAAGAGELVQALDRVYDTFSKDSFSDDAKGKIWENIRLGALQGIQAPKYSTAVDHNFESDAAREQRTAYLTHYADLHEAHEAEMEAKGYEKKNGKWVLNPNKVPKVTTDSTSKTPHITYNGHIYGIKENKGGELGETTYVIYDLETGEIVVDKSLRTEIEDLYKNGATSKSEEDGSGSGSEERKVETPLD